MSYTHRTEGIVIKKKVHAEKLPFWKKIIYALGQFGWSLASYGVANLLVYFYNPPTQNGGDTRMFPVFIGAAAVIGVAGGISRLFDAITDPIIAGLSDRSESPLGRRRKFLLIGAVPFALLSVLVFVPPIQGPSPLNTVWLFTTVILFYLFMTMYVSPYYALISELGHCPEERLQLSTMISITFALGFMTGSSAYGVSGLFEQLLSAETVSAANPASPEIRAAAFQITMALFAGVSLILMMLPVVFIDERRYTEFHVSEEGSFEALVQAFKNRDFRFFALSDLSYWVAMTFVQTGISFYVIMLLGLEKGFATTLLMTMFIFSFLFYVPIGFAAKKFGKKRILTLGFVIFIATAFLMSLWGSLPISAELQGILLVLIAALPMAIFGILPNAIVADIADADGIEKGNFKAAIFFGARTFMQKVGQSISVFLFPIIISLNIGVGGAAGRPPANATAEAGALDPSETGIASGDLGGVPTVTGVRLTAILAGIGLTIGLFLFLKYNEKQVLAVIDSRGRSREPQEESTGGEKPDLQ